MRNTPSAVSLSTMSQPVSMVSAPRLAAPLKKRRRIGSGINLQASLMSSLASMPGMIVRFFMLLPDNHRTDAFRHDQRQRDMHHQKGDNRRHGKEMHIARRI